MEWYVKPETRRIDLPDGQWITVKKRLTVGEERRTWTMLIKDIGPDQRMTPNFELVGLAEVMAYLCDWSATDDQGPIPINTEDRKRAAIQHLPPPTFKVISEAITAHIAEMEAERADRSKNGSGGNGSSPTT